MAFWALKLGVQLLNSGCSGEGDERDERDEECVDDEMRCGVMMRNTKYFFEKVDERFKEEDSIQMWDGLFEIFISFVFLRGRLKEMGGERLYISCRLYGL
jgi:hypothetical protein